MHQQKSNIALMGSLSAIVEYYDFIIYGMMAIYLAEIFFADSVEINYLKTFSILAIGYIARPLGGYFFGIISDLHGRKKSLVMVMSLMALSTLLIGCAPTFSQAGFFAPLLLTLARILQGISFGAEIPTLATAITEQKHKQATGWHFGFLISSTGLGALLASFVVFCLSKFYLHHEIIAWAWRIPFFIGAVLASVVFVIRNRMEESADFIQMKKESKLSLSPRSIMKELVSNHKQNLFCAFSISLFFSFLIILTLYLPVYLNKYFNYPVNTIFSTMTFGIFISMISAPFFGQFFNRFNRIKILQYTLGLFVVFFFFSLKILKLYPNTYSLYAFIIGYQIFIAAYSTNILYLLTTLFPVPIRNTGIGVSYNIAYAVASLTPMILNLLVLYHYELAIILFSGSIGIIAIIGSFVLYKRNILTVNDF